MLLLLQQMKNQKLDIHEALMKLSSQLTQSDQGIEKSQIINKIK